MIPFIPCSLVKLAQDENRVPSSKHQKETRRFPFVISQEQFTTSFKSAGAAAFVSECCTSVNTAKTKPTGDIIRYKIQPIGIPPILCFDDKLATAEPSVGDSYGID